MALIECPECGKRISNLAEECPNCGLPKLYFTKDNSDDDSTIVLKNFPNALQSFKFEYNNIFVNNEYISTFEKKKIFSRYYQYYNKFVADSEVFKRIQKNHVDMRIDSELLNYFVNNMENIDNDIDKYNYQYVEKELINNKEYFDNMLKDIDPDIMLDEEQRRAVIVDEDYCLIVAGAGAGKTTTMAAKVKWLVEKKNINPEEIIVISYTNKAIDELRKRINKKMGIPTNILTFHGFAFNIVKSNVDKRPEVNFSSYNIIKEMIEKKLFKDKNFMRNMILFLGCYFNIPEEVFNFKNLEEYYMFKMSQEYNTLKYDLDKYIDNEKLKRSRRKTTLTGEKMRSASEVQIANYLYLNGIDYEYENIYPHRIQNARKEYTPDFYIKQGNNEAYIEHYGINQNYTSNLYNEDEIKRYVKSIEDKRRLHEKYGTKLIETWNGYSDGKDFTNHLESQLKQLGFKFKPQNKETVYNDILKTGKDKYTYKFIRFMMNFIERYKTEGYESNGFEELRKKTNNVRSLLFLDLAESCYNYYQSYLKSHNQIDFADMINDGARYLDQIKASDIKLPYKYIIIDEFQDIANQRFNFTKKLSEITGAKVIAVGDDWQSIYAFAGSDISLFTKFLNLLGSGKEMKITHTYRNSQELINIAGDFIQKNTTQIKKQLISNKHIMDPIQIISYYDKYNLLNNLGESITQIIGKIIDEYGINSSILIIGRYNFDKYNLLNTEYFSEFSNSYGNKKDRVICNKYPKANLTFLTAHSSKGLGFDNVIIINMNEGKFGFPSQIAVDPIMKLVIHEDNSIAFAEERRLLYVALTRTKNKVYIAAPQNKPSRFVIELIKEYKLKYDNKINMDMISQYTKKCPKCGYPLKKEYNGRLGLQLYICTNEPELCDFMTNSDTILRDIFKCPSCGDGYMIIKKNRDKEDYFYGCTNYEAEKKCSQTFNFNEVD